MEIGLKVKNIFIPYRKACNFPIGNKNRTSYRVAIFSIVLKTGFTLGLVGLLGGKIFDVIKEYEVKEDKRQILILNHIMPRSFDYLVETFYKKKAFDLRRLKSYLYYYQKVAEYMPERADAIGMTGFCFYQLGETDRAIVAYKRALEINPHFFWFYYNLGVIYLKKGRYQEAREAFNKAKDIQPERVLFFIKNSRRIYLPLVAKGMKDIQKELTNQLKEDYRKCYIFTQLIDRDLNRDRLKKMRLEIRMF